MKKNQLQLTLALLFTALFLAVLAALNGLGGFLIRNSGAVQAVSLVARIAAGLAGLGFLVATILIALDIALRPTTRLRKFLYILPVFCLGLLVVGGLLLVFHIGTTGPFAAIWLAISSVLTIVALLATTSLFDLNTATLKRTMTALGITGGFSAIAGLAMIVVVVLALATPRTRGNFGNPDQGGQNAPQGQQGGGTGQGGQQGQGGGQGQGAPQGQFGGEPGEGPRGGPGGFSTLPLIIGGVLLVLFGAAALFFIFRLWRGRSTLTSPIADTSLNPSGQILPAIISLAVFTILVLLVIQLIPVSRDNPPVQTQVTWESADTQQIFTNACADCHSNETQRPWYAYMAPGSWLLASHISEGRSQWNISELNNLQSFRKQQLPNQIAENIRNGTMPPADFQLMHPEARLSEAEKAQLIQGLQKAVASVP